MGKTPFGANCYSGMEKPPLQCQRAAEIGPIPSIARKRKIVEGENHSGLEWWVRENFEEKRAESSLLGCQNSQKNGHILLKLLNKWRIACEKSRLVV
jgi:hypothetical protein